MGDHRKSKKASGNQNKTNLTQGEREAPSLPKMPTCDQLIQSIIREIDYAPPFSKVVIRISSIIYL